MEPETTTVAATGSSKIILGIVAVLVIAGIAWGIASRGGDDTATGDNNDEGSEDTSFSGNIFDLAGRGGEQKCEWSVSAEGYEGTGTVYVDNGKFASVVSGSANGVSFTAHTVSDGEFMYSWTDMAPFGMKISITKAKEMSAQANAEVEATGGTPDTAVGDVSAAYDYDCDSWNPDASIFELPTNITFSEFNY